MQKIQFTQKDGRSLLPLLIKLSSLVIGTVSAVLCSASIANPYFNTRLDPVLLPQQSAFIEYSSHRATFREVGQTDQDADLAGVGVGISTTPYQSGMWGKFEYLKNQDVEMEFAEFSFGGQVNLIRTAPFYTLATIGLGYGWADVEGFDSAEFVSLPIGLEAGFSFTPNITLYGGVGYKWVWDVSAKTTCRDGSTSSSSGSGSCSWHGGISHYNYTVGDFDGVSYRAGLRYNF